MEVLISGDSPGQKLEEYIRSKLAHLARFQDELTLAKAHLSQEQNPRISDKVNFEVTLEGGGHHIRCKVNAGDGFTAVDEAVKKLERQLRKEKTRNLNKWQKRIPLSRAKRRGNQ